MAPASTSYETIAVRPLAGTLGAEIAGLDFRRGLSNQAWSEIHRAFLEHQVLVFRDQELGPDDIMMVGRRFGEPTDYPFVKGIEGYPQIFEVVKEASDAHRSFGNAWHSDTTYLARPPLATLLYAKETPRQGGDTLFANQYLAYETLSAGMQAMLEGLQGVNSASLKRDGGRSHRHDAIGGMKVHDTADAARYEATHPVVRTHPETGRKALYLSRTHTIRFAEMTEAESDPLIGFLAAHATRPDFTCRVSWAPGTLTIWDNRCVQHYAIDDYTGQRRQMQRLTVGAQSPQ
jgi:taurine dioxygenase